MLDGTPRRISRAYRSCLRSLEEIAGEHRRENVSRLPAIPLLARRCGVAGETVRRALRTLHARGVVTVVPGGGVFLRESGPHAEPVLPDTTYAAPLSRWQELRQRINEEISAGVYGPGEPLPSYKELSRRYGSCHATLRKACRVLVEDNRIERYKRGYRVITTGPAPSAASIVLIAITSDMSLLTDFTPRSNEFWRVLERECQRLGVVLHVHGLYETLGMETRPDGLRRTIEAIEHRGRNLGYIIFGVGPTQEQLEHLLTDMHRAQRPAVILDESGGLRVPSLVHRANLFRVFTVGPGPLPGRLVGEYLLSLGHRRVAYFATSSADLTGSSRYRGLCDAFTRAGLPDAVSLHVPTRLDGPGSRQLSRQMHADEDMHDILQTSSAYQEALEEHGRHHDVSLLSYAVGQELTRENQRRFLYPAFEPLFDNLRGRPEVTAWVAYNDLLGLLAHSYLQAHGTALPRDLSLVSFDDTIESFGHGLTSYNFNMTQVTHNMLDHILNYAPNRRRTPSVVEIPGMIMQRGSSGRVPGGRSRG